MQDNSQLNFVAYVPNGGSTSASAQRKRPPPSSINTRMSTNAVPYNLTSQPPPKRRKILALPQDVQSLVPESAILNDLQAFEYRLDKVLTDKKLRMRQLLTDPRTMKRKLRVNVYTEKQTIKTTTESQPSSEYFEENWTIYIQGTLMDENAREEDLQHVEQYKFTYFLKSMIVEMDEELFPVKSDRIIEWHRTHGFEDCEGFQFTRKVRLASNSVALNRKYPVKIMFGVREDPPLYRISPQLNEVIGASAVLINDSNSSSTPTTSKAGKHQQAVVTDKKLVYPSHTLNNILTGVWNYIKMNKLQDDQDKNRVVCDEKLKEIFCCDSMSFANVLQQIKQQLLLPEPIVFDHEVCRTRMGQAFEERFMMDVTLSKPQQTEVEALLSEKPLPDVQKYDSQIQKALEGIEAHKKKRDFMLGFSSDPVNFIHKLISSQTRDLLLMNSQELEQSRYASYYKSPWIQEAVHRYASKK